MGGILKINENYIFRRAYTKGKTFVTPYAVVYLLRNRDNAVRLGITTGKKIGKAVSRNRAKRVITAAFRQCLPYIAAGHDIVIVARPRILTVKSNTVEFSLAKALREAGIYCDTNDIEQDSD